MKNLFTIFLVVFFSFLPVASTAFSLPVGELPMKYLGVCYQGRASSPAAYVSATSTYVSPRSIFEVVGDDDGNGIVSVCAFENSRGELVYERILDDFYTQMGRKSDSILVPERTENVSFLDNLIPRAYAAIALDTTISMPATVGTGQTSTTYSYTVSGSDTFLVVDVINALPASQSTASITFNGDSLTLIAHATQGANADADLWGILSPASGAHNVVITFAIAIISGGEFIVHTSSYTGVSQATPVASLVAGTNAGNSNTASKALTPVSSGAWMVFGGYNDCCGLTSYTNLTGRQFYSTVPLADSNGVSTTGGVSFTGTETISGSGNWVVTAFFIDPAAGGGGGGSTSVFATTTDIAVVQQLAWYVMLLFLMFFVGTILVWGLFIK